MKDHPLGLAARYNDADAEERDITSVIEGTTGFKIDDVMYLAEQRALRMLGIVMPERFGWLLGNKTSFEPVALTTEDRLTMISYQSAVLDGIMIGWRAHEIDDRR